jgi:CDP-glucose 4,6-dehydratase
VTGATGLVGGWLVRRLLAAGADVVCLVRDWVPRSDLVAAGLIDQVKVVRGDVRDQETVERALGEYEIATVLHLAAQTTVGVANRNPVSTLDTNIRGTWALLEACRRSPAVQQIVTASSDKAYGDQEVLPYTEDAPVSGRHPYDVSKSCADLLAQMYAKSYRLPVCVTRCGNFYGGGDLNWNRIVPGTIRSVIRGERPVIRSDGQFTRDYLYVEDGARAYLLLAEQLAARPELRGEVFNFSYEIRMTVLELVTKLLAAMSSNLEPDVRNETLNEIRDQYLDATKAKTMLGWTPRFTVEAGLRATVDWYKEYLRG